MRIGCLLLCASLAACASHPKGVASVVAHTMPGPSSAPPSKPSVQARPNIVDVVAPKGACVVAGRTFEGFDLSGRVDGPPLLHVGPGDANLTVANRVTFAEVVTPTLTLRGFVSQDARMRRAFVYSKKWLSFGGVYFPGIQTSLHVFGEHDGKIVLDAPDLTPLTLSQKNRWVEVGCEDVSLAPDPSSAQRTDLPPAFFPLSNKQMILEGTEPIAISAEPHGEAAGEIRLESHPWNEAKAVVYVLETKGDQAHIRWDHLVGWIPIARLSKASPNAVKMAAFTIAPAAEDRDPGKWVVADPLDLPATPLICKEDVPLAASSDEDVDSFVMGKIPAGQPVRGTPMNERFAFVKLDGLSTTAYGRELQPRRASSIVGTWSVELGECIAAPDAAAPRQLSVDVANDFIARAILSDTVDALTAQVRASAVDPNLPQRAPRVRRERKPWEFGVGYIPPGPHEKDFAVRATGPLSPALVDRILRERFDQVLPCLREHVQAGDYRNSGGVQLRVVIDEAGRVSSITDTGSTGLWLPARGCIARGISKILFPAPTTAEESVDYAVTLY